jgi:hypothetical protein
MQTWALVIHNNKEAFDSLTIFFWRLPICEAKINPVPFDNRGNGLGRRV